MYIMDIYVANIFGTYQIYIYIYVNFSCCIPNKLINKCKKFNFQFLNKLALIVSWETINITGDHDQYTEVKIRWFYVLFYIP